MPVTSTKVATKGLEAIAGSAPRRLKTIGSMEPISVPHRQMPATARPITSDSRQRSTGGCGTVHLVGNS